MTSIEHFANQHRLRTKRDEVKDLIIPGRLGHLYEHEGGVLALMLASPNGDDPRLDSTLRSRMRKALREGLELHQRGDYESTFVFDPENKQHARLAIQLVGARKKRATGRPFTSERARMVGRGTQFSARPRRLEGHGTAQKPANQPSTTPRKGQEETTLVYAGGGHEGTTGGGS